MPDPIVVPRLTRVRGAAARSTTWWGRAFVRSFEELSVGTPDLVDARALARSGRLGAIMVIEAMASSVVDLTIDAAVLAQIRVRRLDAASWATFAEETARESGFAAALESENLPVDLVEHADEAGVELLPGTDDIDTACECDAWTQPCAHVLALLYQLAWQIDRDPYVLFLLRGRTREALLAEVASQASCGSAAEPAPAAHPAPGDEEREQARVRAARVLALADQAPSGHGLADAAVATYDEEVARLL